MSKHFLHQDDCHIKRREDSLSGRVAELYDSDGDKRWTFSGDMSDNQIIAAVDFANRAFEVGVLLGENNKVRQIKTCLGIA